MKLILMATFIFSATSQATTLLPDLSSEDCVTTCRSTGQHTFQRHGRYSICHEVMSCDVLEWNDDVNSCEQIKTETRRVPMMCRDIPPTL